MANNLGIKTSMKIEGLDGLRLALQELPKEVAKKVLSNAVSKGARVVRDEAKQIVPTLKVPDKRRTAGLLKRMLRVVRGKRRSDTESASFVAVRGLSNKKIAAFKKATGKKGADNPLDPFYWSILEFGKSSRTAHPFIRPAFNRKKEVAAKAIGTELDKGIQKIARQLHQKTRGMK